MSAAGSDVILRRVKLQGRAPAPRGARRELLQALDDTPWPPTAAGEIIQLRFVKVKGTPRAIAITLAREVQRLVDHAMDGWAEGAEHAPAIRFRSRPDQLACLLRDILAGSLPHRWFWDDWCRQAPAASSAALVRVFQDDPLATPSVLARLADSPVVAAFWAVLEPADAEHLLRLIGHASGWGGLIQTALNGEPDPPPPDLTLAFRVAPVPLPPYLSAQDPRVVLAALLSLWQRSPGLLQGSRGVAALRAAARGLAEPARRTEAPQTAFRQPAGAPGPPATEALVSRAAPEPAAVKTEGNAYLERDLTQPGPPPERSGSPLASQPPAPRPDNLAAPGPDNPAPPGPTRTEALARQMPPEQVVAADSLAPAGPELVAGPRSDWEVGTHQGGIFYLLNALAWEGYQQRLPDWEAPGAGWRLMWRLGLALGCRPDAGLEAFMLREAALSEVELQDLSPLAEPLARLGALRYGDSVWNSGLFTLPARVRVGRSHADVHFRLEDARLEIRRAGLDINPGWLPWLGRVVTFHYGSGLEPERP